MSKSVFQSRIEYIQTMDPDLARAFIPTAQVAVYTMAGGGMLGRFAGEQPGDFYIDARVGRLPYGRRQIEGAVQVLVALAERAGLDPKNMPKMPPFHNLGVF